MHFSDYANRYETMRFARSDRDVLEITLHV